MCHRIVRMGDVGARTLRETRTFAGPGVGTDPIREVYVMQKIIRRSARAVAVSAIALTSAFGAAATAHAGTNEAITVNGGQATFQHHGEILTATDTRRDGRCVTATLSFIGAGPNAPVVYEDVTACGRGDVARKNLNLSEGALLRVCYTGGGAADKCSRWQNAHA